MVTKRSDRDDDNTRHRVRVGTENRVEPLSIQDVQRRVSELGLATPADAQTMAREDRDSR